MKLLILLALLSLTGCATLPPIKLKTCYTTKYGTVCATVDKDAIAVDLAIKGLSKD